MIKFAMKQIKHLEIKEKYKTVVRIKKKIILNFVCKKAGKYQIF